MEFIYAKSLKTQFECYGHFYTMSIDSKKKECRSILEIVEKKFAKINTKNLSMQKPDAIFIMMNPGSSSPKTNQQNEETIEYESLKRLEPPKKLVLAKPDMTQYQIMRLMDFKKWEHVRIVNLSDMRNPKSGKFVEEYKEVKDNNFHSLFSEERRNEMIELFKRKKEAPIILAWGMNEALIDLAENCLNKIKEYSYIGERPKKNKPLFYHPLPSLQKNKVKWLKETIKLIQTQI